MLLRRKFTTAQRFADVERFFLHVSFGMCEVEQKHLGAFLSDDVQAEIVGGRQQPVVAVDKLQIFAPCHLYAGIACLAEPFVPLSQIDYFVTVSHQFVDGAFFRPVIHDDNLPFALFQ